MTEANMTMTIDPQVIAERIARFRDDLIAMKAVDVVRKHVIHGSCYVLTDDAYLHLRSEVANRYGLHPNDVLVVGSGKLGFSIAPLKRYQHFCDTSDVDVVVVSNVLFDDLWKKLHHYVEQGGYWENFVGFKDYLFNGWIRPDKLPSAESFAMAKEWWEFFNRLSRSGIFSTFKVRGAIYRDWYFLESYQLRSVSSCQDAAMR
jgi:hypothetical protein